MATRLAKLIKEISSKNNEYKVNHRYELHYLVASVGELSQLQAHLGCGAINRGHGYWDNHKGLIQDVLIKLIDYSNSQGYNLEELINEIELEEDYGN